MSDPILQYKLKETVDVLDSRSLWDLGVIEQMTQDAIVVSWPLWPSYGPETIHNWKVRVAPLGTHVGSTDASQKYKEYFAGRKPDVLAELANKSRDQAEELFKRIGADICASKIWPSYVKGSEDMTVKDDAGQDWAYRCRGGKAYLRRNECKTTTSLAGVMSVTDCGDNIACSFMPFVDTSTSYFEQPKATTYFASLTSETVIKKLTSTDDTGTDLWADFLRQGSVDYTIHIGSAASTDLNSGLEADAKSKPNSICPADGDSVVKVHSAVLCSQSDVILAQVKNTMKADEKTTREWVKTNPFMTAGAARLFCRVLYRRPDPANGATFRERMAANMLWTDMGLRRSNPFFDEPEIGQKILKEENILEASSYAMKIKVAAFTEAVNRWMTAKENTEKLRMAIEKHSISLMKSLETAASSISK